MEIISAIAMTGFDLLYAGYELLTPEPTTPIFMKGGMLHGYNEDLTMTAAFITFLAFIDFAIVKRVIVPKARYFALHVVCNALVCVLSAPGVYRCFTNDPYTVFRGPGTTAGNAAIAALHLYHCIAFNLSADDIFHHLTFCASLCSMAIPAKTGCGDSIAMSGFFISGLPGGIDYLMLTLSAHGYVSKELQKSLYTKINVWMRAPALTVFSFLWWLTRFSGPHPFPMIITVLTTPLHYYNGQYYMQQAIESNALFTYKKKLEASGVKVPEVKLNDLVAKKEGKGTSSSAKKKTTRPQISVNISNTAEDYGDSSVMSPVSGSHVPQLTQRQIS